MYYEEIYEEALRLFRKICPEKDFLVVPMDRPKHVTSGFDEQDEWDHLDVEDLINDAEGNHGDDVEHDAGHEEDVTKVFEEDVEKNKLNENNNEKNQDEEEDWGDLDLNDESDFE